MLELVVYDLLVFISSRSCHNCHLSSYYVLTMLAEFAEDIYALAKDHYRSRLLICTDYLESGPFCLRFSVTSYARHPEQYKPRKLLFILVPPFHPLLLVHQALA